MRRGRLVPSPPGRRPGSPAPRPAAGAATRRRPRDRREPERQVLRRACHQPGDHDGVPHPVGGLGGDQAGGGAEPGHPAEGRRDAERPSQVGPLRQREHAGREPRRPAAGRPSRRERRVPRVAGCAEHVVEGVGPRGELRRVGLAHHHRPGGPQAAHHQRVLRGHVVRVQRRAVGGAQPRHRRHVLDPDRHPRERPDVLSPRQPPVDRARTVEGARGEGHHRIDHPVVPTNAVERRRHRLLRRHLPRGDQPGELDGREKSQVADSAHDVASMAGIPRLKPSPFARILLRSISNPYCCDCAP